MKKLILSLCLAVAFGTTALSQQRTVADTAPSKEDVLRFMDLLQLRARMDQLLDGMKKGMKAGAEAGFKQKIHSATPEQLAKLDSVTEAVFNDFPLGEIMDAMVPIYQKHLTKSDLDAVIAFYSSPAGQKLLKEQPAMMAEGMQAGQDIMLHRLPDIEERLRTKVAQLAEQELQGSSPEGKKPR
jgi:hypothetical protein